MEEHRMRQALLFGGLIWIVSACATREVFHLQTISGGPKLPGVAVDAKQRFVWTANRPVRMLSEETGNNYRYKTEPRDILCAEPSPDAVSALSASLSASLGVALEKVNVDASVARSVSETIQQLTQRTEMIQLLRDAYYRACEGYANGMVGEFGYGLLLNQIDNVMVKLAALNIVGEQRPLPESAADRQSLAKAKSGEIELAGAQERLTAARSALAAATQGLTGRMGEYDSAQTDTERVQAMRDQTDTALKDAGLTVEEKARLREQLRTSEAQLAAAKKRKALSESRMDDSTKERAVAKDALTVRESEVKAAEKSLSDARVAAAAISQPPFDREALRTIETIVKQSHGHSTVIGACLMWLSQHLNVRAQTRAGEEPELVAACREFIRTGLTPSAANP